jgi:hypothetical protein
LRPFPERIREGKDLDSMKIDKLVGSLQTYELSLPQPKRKNLSLKTIREKVSDSTNEYFSKDEDFMTLLTKNF